ncbi:MAG: 2-ketoisovalerate ferredoxin reductase subunit alpha [Candidatus Scalindua rubra]|uniref:2-ketoisovalerate ferredoxin reductase subunit alpha n=1 Tax=Candidatus Scalindua rubra TaxID=1872076 RepID=A0A1E3X4H1_9BACT|nr:MAG: 2-ketoisovalerate ferredoxin reductase subunit alpha [Candidatus Scalindua rubra]
MVKEMLTGNYAAAWGARLSEVDYVPAFPITPQTEIIEVISKWINDGEMNAKFTNMDSEHSMITAAGTAAATGARVFSATSSQGLLYGYEMLYSITGWRVPLVFINVSRGLSAPITLEPDHNDVLSTRDSGLIQIHAETCQEILDSILMAYRIAEDERVLLPVLINMDGFYLSFTREPVEIPGKDEVSKFLSEYNPKHAYFKASKPMAQGVAVLGGSIYSYFKYQMHLAALNAITVHNEVASDFKRIFGRSYSAIEAFKIDDADCIIIMSNSFTIKGKAAINKFREKGLKVGLLRLRLIRPFPLTELRTLLNGKKAVAVIDQNISPGSGGILFNDVSSALYHEPKRPEVILSFIGGLGGKDISHAEFSYIIEEMKKSVETGVVPETQLLYTKHDLEQINKFLNIAEKTSRKTKSPKPVYVSQE